MKLFLIRLADLVDEYVFRHNWHWLCNKVAYSDWWKAGRYTCPKCKIEVSEGFFGGHTCLD